VRALVTLKSLHETRGGLELGSGASRQHLYHPGTPALDAIVPSWHLMLPMMFGSNPPNPSSNLNHTCPNRYFQCGSDGLGLWARPSASCAHACKYELVPASEPVGTPLEFGLCKYAYLYFHAVLHK